MVEVKVMVEGMVVVEVEGMLNVVAMLAHIF
jgi:hypothetical protein